MRIVAGAFRGRALFAPAGRSTRPTSDRARQGLFDILEHAPWAPGLAGARVVDLFAGSGALGIEALSRGADFCLFVETDREARAAIGANLDHLDLKSRASIDPSDATRLAQKSPAAPPFDLAFADPPYGSGLAAPALLRLTAGGWLAGQAIVVVEQAARDAPIAAAGFQTLAMRDFGAARITFLRPL